MKSIAAAASLLFAASLLQAQPQPVVEAADTQAPAAKVAPAKAPAAKDEKKKEPEEPKIPGFVITRPNGTYLGLEVVNGNWKLSFYDKKKKAMPIDVTRATARWPNPRARGDNRTVLNPVGTALVGSKPALPPFNYSVILTLLQGDGDAAKAVENYVVPFRG